MRPPVDVESVPRRLADGGGASAALLRAARAAAHGARAASADAEADEAAAWTRLVARQEKRRRTQRRALVVAGSLALGAAGVVAMVTRQPAPAGGSIEAAASAQRDRGAPTHAGVAIQPLPSGAPAATTSAPARALELGPRPARVDAGAWTLGPRVRVRVEATTAVEARAPAPGSARIGLALDRGAIDVDVAPGAGGGAGVEIGAGPFRLADIGTVFHVERARGRVALAVTEGAVTVSRGRRLLATVTAGQRWAGDEMPEPAVATPSSDPAGASGAAGGPNCGTLAPRAAVPCWLAAASRGGPDADTALYEAARLRRDRLGEPDAALRAFRLYQSRFPDGNLRLEVALSVIELLPKLGRHREALAESARLLAHGDGAERAAELRLLRGNIYREALSDCARAEPEYAAAAVAAGGGAQVDEALFFRGVCLEQLGRGDEARATYRQIASRPAAHRAAEARRRLEALGETAPRAPGTP